MTITAITNAIDNWKKNNGGECPSLTDLYKVLACDRDDLADDIKDAEKLQILYEPQIGRYDYRQDMI